MIKQKGLGRGLDALLGGDREQAKQGEQLGALALTALKPGKYQPRTRMSQEALAELADSIKARGVIQPILVREPWLFPRKGARPSWQATHRQVRPDGRTE